LIQPLEHVVVYSQMSSNYQCLLPDISSPTEVFLHMLAWTVQQEKISVPPLVSIMVISAAWRKFTLDVTCFKCFGVFRFVYFLHRKSQLRY